MNAAWAMSSCSQLCALLDDSWLQYDMTHAAFINKSLQQGTGRAHSPTVLTWMV